MDPSYSDLIDIIARYSRSNLDSFTYGTLLSQKIQVSVVMHFVNQPEMKPIVITSYGCQGDSHPELQNSAKSFASALADTERKPK